jgi:hypothetical protein
MDATITNLGTTSPDDDVFLTTPKVEVKAGQSVTLAGLTIADLDGDTQLKQLVIDGKVSVQVGDEIVDRAVPTRGTMRIDMLPRYTFATLPTAPDAFDGLVAFCTNGRKVGEGGGAGTGVPVYFDGASWRVFSTDAAVAV